MLDHRDVLLAPGLLIQSMALLRYLGDRGVNYRQDERGPIAVGGIEEMSGTLLDQCPGRRLALQAGQPEVGISRPTPRGERRKRGLDDAQARFPDQPVGGRVNRRMALPVL